MCGRKEFGPPRDGAPGALNNFPMKVLGFSISKIKKYIENTEIRASGVIIKKISIFWTFFLLIPIKKKFNSSIIEVWCSVYTEFKSSVRFFFTR